jgi:hypothetical protein
MKLECRPSILFEGALSPDGSFVAFLSLIEEFRPT